MLGSSLLIIISNILLEQIVCLSMSVGCWFVINIKSFHGSYKETFFVEISNLLDILHGSKCVAIFT